MIAERIDVHAHLLPGLDDGSSSMDESIELARRLAEAGYAHAFCTPHFWPGYETYTPAFIRRATDELREQLRLHRIPLELHPGAEINLDMPIDTLTIDQVPTYGMRGFYALMDFWESGMPERFLKRIDYLISHHVRPIIAHPERIAAFQVDPDLLDRLADERRVLFQCNLQCLSDPKGRPTRDLAERWLKAGKYFMIGSDTHNLRTLDLRLEGLEVALDLVGDHELHRLTVDNPAKLLK